MVLPELPSPLQVLLWLLEVLVSQLQSLHASPVQPPEPCGLQLALPARDCRPAC